MSENHCPTCTCPQTVEITRGDTRAGVMARIQELHDEGMHAEHPSTSCPACKAEGCPSCVCTPPVHRAEAKFDVQVIKIPLLEKPEVISIPIDELPTEVREVLYGQR